MRKKNLTENQEMEQDLVEFKSSDDQSETADPVATKDSKRPADKTAGETSIPDFPTKIEAINAVIQMMSGMPKEKIGDIFKGMSVDNSAKNKRPKDQTGGETSQIRLSPTSAMAKEDMDVIFGGEELSEELREKAVIVFEAAVNSRLATEVVRLEEEFESRLVEALEEKVEQLTENVDKYLSYAVEQWVEDNEVAIESGLKAEVVEGFIHGLKGLFEENYIEIPDDKVDVIAEMASKIEELEDAINSTISENIDLHDYVDSLEVDRVFAEAVESLPLTQQEKLRSLVEGIEYNDVEEFTKKVSVIKETYFPSGKKAASLTEEYINEDDAEEVVAPSGPMAHYVTAISKTTKK